MARPKKVTLASTLAKKQVVPAVGRMTVSDLDAALTDRYPHHDMRFADGKRMEVAVPGGMITVDLGKLATFANTAELRAYIDALPVL